MNANPNTVTLTIEKGALKFSAGHFTIFSATQRERMHGHNYYLALTYEAELAEPGLSFDYRILKSYLRERCRYLDGYFLLPTQSPYLEIRPKALSQPIVSPAEIEEKANTELNDSEWGLSYSNPPQAYADPHAGLTQPSVLISNPASESDYIEAIFNGQRLLFWREDIRLLSIPNITLEALSQWFLEDLVSQTSLIESCQIVALSLQLFNGEENSGVSVWHR